VSIFRSVVLPQPLRIAVLSDLHCHPKNDGTQGQNRTHFFSDGPRTQGNRHPIQWLVDLIATETPQLQVDLVALPGDFTDQANLHGYIVAVHSLREVASLLGAKAIAATLGNHDVDSRGSIGLGPFYAARQMFPDFPISDRAQSNSFFNQGFAILEGENFRVLLVNSVISHTTKDASEAGLASPVELAALRAALSGLPPKAFNLCLVHHHVIPHEQLQLGAKDLMVGGEELLRLLEELGFCLVIHGHKHHPRLRYSTTGLLPVFAAGSLSAAIDPITGSDCRNTFHIIDLNTPGAVVNNIHGQIHTWELKLETGWTRTTRKSSGFPGLAGFGFRSSIESLAQQIAEYFAQAGLPFLRWTDIVTSIPQLAYLIPTDVEAISRHLLSVHRLKADTDPAEPIMIGRPVP